MINAHYGKMVNCMTNINQPTIEPPKVIASIKTGFDSVTKNISLILFPILLDLFLWLGPHISVKPIIDNLINSMGIYEKSLGSDFMTLYKENINMWELVGDRFNVFVSLRTFPVGVPSLLTSIMPIETPLGKSMNFELNSLVGLGLLIIGFMVIGLFIGAYYFRLVSHAVINGSANWFEEIKKLPRTFIYIMMLSVIWIGVVFAVSVPASCIITFSALGNSAISMFFMFIYGIALLWILVPVFFSTYGIFLYKENVLKSIKDAIRTLNNSFPAVSMYLLAVMIISQLFDMVWRIPKENSWLLLIGIIGHAFVSTSLLASSFVFYRDAKKWTNMVVAMKQKKI